MTDDTHELRTAQDIALGASFSPLEVVPLTCIGFELYHTDRLGHATPWMARHRSPILFFVAESFWSLVGAGHFVFLINPPLSLYWLPGLDLTPLNGHTALFGVYDMLGIGLVLFSLRGLERGVQCNERLPSTAFRGLNVGAIAFALFVLSAWVRPKREATLPHAWRREPPGGRQRAPRAGIMPR